jgi:Flp pilus assembly protein TadB
MILDYFPSIGMRSVAENDLKMLGVNPGRYLSMALILSIVISLALSVIFNIVMLPVIFGGIFGLFMILPKIEINKRKSLIESQLPFFLREVGIMIELGVPFITAFSSAGAGKSALAPEVRQIAQECENGMGFQKALAMLGRKYHSLGIRRAISQLTMAYESGSKGPEIRRIGDDMLAVQSHSIKEFSSKSALIGLVFIMTSVVMPTFFLVYASAGSFAFDAVMGEQEIAITMLLVFPLASILVLVFSKSIMPPDIFSEQKGFDIIMAVPAVITVIGTLLFPNIQLVFLLLGIVSGAFIIARTYPQEKRREEIEGRLADAVFSVSGLPKSAKAEDVFRIIKKGGFGPLSEEARVSLRQMEMNVRTEMVLADLWKRNRSVTLKRICAMLGQMIDTCSLDRMGLLADDIIAASEMRRERGRVFSLQKYTLILGSLLIPLIMRMVVGLLAGLENATGGGIIVSEQTILSYILIYAGIASVGIGEFEGRKSLSAICLILLSVAGFSVFHLINI